MGKFAALNHTEPVLLRQHAETGFSRFRFRPLFRLLSFISALYCNIPFDAPTGPPERNIQLAACFHFNFKISFMFHLPVSDASIISSSESAKSVFIEPPSFRAKSATRTIAILNNIRGTALNRRIERGAFRKTALIIV
jgi:hypothetical protein